MSRRCASKGLGRGAAPKRRGSLANRAHAPSSFALTCAAPRIPERGEG